MRNSAVKTEAGSMTLDQVFKALGDPHRLQIMQLLREKEMSAGEILESVDVVQSTLSHHMKSLVESGIVNAARHGKWTYYSINEETMKEAESLLHDYSLGTKTMAVFDSAETGAGRSADTAKGAAGNENMPGDNSLGDSKSQESHILKEDRKQKQGSAVKENRKPKESPASREEKKPKESPASKEDKKARKNRKGKKGKK